MSCVGLGYFLKSDNLLYFFLKPMVALKRAVGFICGCNLTVGTASPAYGAATTPLGLLGRRHLALR